MKYPVLNDFIEKFHKNMLYKKGETYPKDGFEADPERVKYLQSEKNKYKIPFLGPEIKENDKEKEEVASFDEDEPVEEKVQEEIASIDEHIEESSDEEETDEAETAKKGGKNNSRKRKPAEK